MAVVTKTGPRRFNIKYTQQEHEARDEFLSAIELPFSLRHPLRHRTGILDSYVKVIAEPGARYASSEREDKAPGIALFPLSPWEPLKRLGWQVADRIKARSYVPVYPVRYAV